MFLASAAVDRVGIADQLWQLGLEVQRLGTYPTPARARAKIAAAPQHALPHVRLRKEVGPRAVTPRPWEEEGVWRGVDEPIVQVAATAVEAAENVKVWNTPALLRARVAVALVEARGFGR